MFDTDSFIIEPMRWGDVPQVMEIERESFSLPWPERAYRYELHQNKQSHYAVLRRKTARAPGGWRKHLNRLLRRAPRAPILAFGGFWIVAGEMHISTLAVTPTWRRRGLGELVLWSLLKQALSLGAVKATLEVRVSNFTAQNLYLKYGFEKADQHRRYYKDNNEDAWVMTMTDLDGEPNLARLSQLGRDLQRRLREAVKEGNSAL